MSDKRADLAKRDLENLMLLPSFQRFLYTIFESAPMLSGAYGSDGRHLPFAEGRRSLGFDILRSVEAIRPDALIAVLTAEHHAQLEYPDGRQPRYDPRDELADDGDPVGAEGRRPGTGLVRYELVDYGRDVDAAS